MKKVLFVLAVVLLTACGESTVAPIAPEVTIDTTFKSDSLTEIPTGIDAERAIDTIKEQN